MSINDIEQQIVLTLAQATRGPAVAPEHILAWTGRLPDALLRFWAEVGFATLPGGLIRLIPPAILAPVLEFAFAGDPDFAGDLHAIAIGPFGEVFTWSQRHGFGFLNATAGAFEVPYLLHPTAPDGDAQIVHHLIGFPADALEQLDLEGQPLSPQLNISPGPLEGLAIWGAVPVPPEPGRKSQGDFMLTHVRDYLEAVVNETGIIIYDWRRPEPMLRAARDPWEGPSPVPVRKGPVK